MATSLQPRTLRPAPEPLGSFIRPGYNDHVVMEQALTERRGSGTGLVFNPIHAERQLPLVVEANASGIETVLDSKSLELSSFGGYARSGVQDLQWAVGGAMHTPVLLGGENGSVLVRELAQYAADAQVSGVLAPTHFLSDAADPWWEIDARLTRELRAELDAHGMEQTLIYYPVMVKAASLMNPVMMTRLIDQLRGLPVDGVWLRLHPFGTTNSGPLALARYIQLCRSLHELGVPLVAEHSGTIGVALLAVGAVGGIESGVTFTDTVNLDTLLRRPKEGGGGGYLPSPRVYLHQLGAFVDPALARDFFDKRGMKALHGCQDTSCCPRGWIDMVANPRRHFLRQRASEVAQLASMPASLRAGFYMEHFLRPASDRAIRSAEREPSLAKVRKRLEYWRGTLGADLEQHPSFTVSVPATGRRLRRSA